MSEALDPEEFKNWTPAAQEEYLRALQAASDAKVWYCTDPGRECDGLPHDGVPYRHARASQWPPPLEQDWLTWLMLSGRGAGKTRSAAEFVRKSSAYAPRIALVAATGPDLREVMIEGDSGLLAVCANAGTPGRWEPSRRRFTFHNGAVAYGYAAEEPDRLRGPQFHLAWADEPAHWANLQATWDNLLFGLRLRAPGWSPRVAATTTPVPSPWIKTLSADPLTQVTRDSTYANIDNLAPSFAKTILERYEGTRLGRQELYGEILEDVEGAIWTHDLMEATRVEQAPQDLSMLVVGIDPAGSATARSDETGIVLVGRDYSEPAHVYVIADRSGRYTPSGWADAAANLYRGYLADKIVAEDNFGGEMVAATFSHSQPDLPLSTVNSRHGKRIRALPVHALHEQGRLHMVGRLPELEDQMLSWLPESTDSPDRLDALVHAVHAVVDVAPPSAIASAAGTTDRPAPALPSPAPTAAHWNIYVPPAVRNSDAVRLAKAGVLPR